MVRKEAANPTGKCCPTHAMIETTESLNTKLPPPIPYFLFPLQRLRDSPGIIGGVGRPMVKAAFAIRPVIWEECEHNPRLLLPGFLNIAWPRWPRPRLPRARQQASKRFDRYMADRETGQTRKHDNDHQEHPVAYFCASMGFTIRFRFIQAGSAC